MHTLFWSIWLVKQDIIFMLVTFFVYRMSWLLQVWNMDLITAHLLDGMRSVLFVCVKILNWLLKIPSSYSVLIEYCFPLIKQRLVSCLKISFSVWVSKKRKHQSGKGMSIVKLCSKKVDVWKQISIKWCFIHILKWINLCSAK